MLPAIGFALAGVAGLTLGLVGGGGSLLTVPILVYGFELSTLAGSSYSLFIVGLTALFGAATAWKKGLLDPPMVGIFLLTSLPAAYLTRTVLLHALPETLVLPGLGTMGRESLLMGAFGLLMILAALLTAVQPESVAATTRPNPMRLVFLSILGAAVGSMTGLFGAGGGFLIVPALVLAARLPMPKAIGTSLAIVAGNAAFGLAGDWRSNLEWDWSFLLLFTALTLAGMALGRALGGRLRPTSLRFTSAAMLLAVGLFTVLKEISQGVP